MVLQNALMKETFVQVFNLLLMDAVRYYYIMFILSLQSCLKKTVLG